MSQYTTLGLDVTNLFRRITKEDMIELDDESVGKSVKLKEIQCQ